MQTEMETMSENLSSVSETESFEDVCILFMNSINDAKERISMVENVYRNKVCLKFQEEISRMRNAITLEEKSHEQCIIDWGMRRQALITEIDNLKTQFELEKSRFIEELKTSKLEKHQLHQELNSFKDEFSIEKDSMRLAHAEEMQCMKKESETKYESLRLELLKERNELKKSIRHGKELRRAYMQLKEKYCAEDEYSYFDLSMHKTGRKRRHFEKFEQVEVEEINTTKITAKKNLQFITVHSQLNEDTLTSNLKSNLESKFYGSDYSTDTESTEQVDEFKNSHSQMNSESNKESNKNGSDLSFEKNINAEPKLKRRQELQLEKSNSNCIQKNQMNKHEIEIEVKKNISCDLNKRFKNKEKEKEKEKEREKRKERKKEKVKGTDRALENKDEEEDVKEKEVIKDKEDSKWRNTRLSKKGKEKDDEEEESHDDFLNSPRMAVLSSLALKKTKISNSTASMDSNLNVLSDSEETVILDSSEFKTRTLEFNTRSSELKSTLSNSNTRRANDCTVIESKIKSISEKSNFDQSTKPSVPNFKFNSVVRKKADREGLKAMDCTMCEKFYEAVLAEDAEGVMMSKCEHHQIASRHRYNYIPPSTPKGFWNIGFDSELESS